jgi:hypothetical protein
MATDDRAQKTVRMRPETFALFDQMQRQLNEQLPFGKLSRAELLDICVSSTSAALAAGTLQIGQKRGRRVERTFVPAR